VIVSPTEAGDHAAGQPPAAVGGPPDPDNDQRPLLLWCAVVLSTWAWPAAIVGAVCATAGLRLQAAGWRYAGEFAVGVTFASGVVLACVRNIHGVALLVGLVLAALVSGVARAPLPPQAAESPCSGAARSPLDTWRGERHE
jgi:hypothetical protein